MVSESKVITVNMFINKEHKTCIYKYKRVFIHSNLTFHLKYLKL